MALRDPHKSALINQNHTSVSSGEVVKNVLSTVLLKISGECLRIFSANVRYEMTLLNFRLFA